MCIRDSAGKASITATVQTSDDGKTVKEEKSAALTSGTGTVSYTHLDVYKRQAAYGAF